MTFSTKGGTLAALRGRLEAAEVLPLSACSVAAWQADAREFLGRIVGELGPGPYIVRSSSSAEDTATQSNAGAFLSVTDVDEDSLAASIDDVVASYGAEPGQHEVLVQPMLTDVTSAGVALSHDPLTCSPYRIISWTEDGKTDAVTGGRAARTWQVAHAATQREPDAVRGVLALLEEVSGLTGGVPIDIEFARTCSGGEHRLWLLQARPLILRQTPEAPRRQAARIEIVRDKIFRALGPHPFLKGRRTIFGVMPDWNPAEIIGLRPRPLALSLYRELVTDAIWAYQRSNYGYRNLRSFPLMQDFFGLPYIDVRLSFNSFIPADISDALADRLVDHYTDALLTSPTLHDKVEFEIVLSCYTLDLEERLEALPSERFSSADRRRIADSLRGLTNRIVHPESGLWIGDAARLDTLEARREEMASAGMPTLDRIYWLLEDAKRYGTLPFAGLARAGFIAVQMLRSMRTTGIIDDAGYALFMSSVSTISGQLARDRGELDRTTFLARYGHLRPGTYDILSPRYDEDPDRYFDWDAARAPESSARHEPFAMTLVQMRELSTALQAHGLAADPVSLLHFIESAIELREAAKFRFTRSLSDALSLITEYGAELGFTRDDLSYCSISAFRDLYVSAASPREVLERSINAGQVHHAETSALALPPLITDPDDAWAFEWPDHAPNFITQGKAVGPVRCADQTSDLSGAIVCIENADPGYDWVFSQDIAALITAWGGSNSHMAIRAGELGVPAVIGAGDALYRQWSGAKRLHIDCGTQIVEPLA